MIVVNEKQASKILNMSVEELKKLREEKQPPRFIKLGSSIAYSITELEEYLIKKTKKFK